MPSVQARRRQWHPTPVLLPGKPHGWRSLVGCSPWGRWGSDTTERLHFHFSLSCIGEGNGNPLQRSCPENPRDGGARWAAIYGVAQSWTWLRRLSSSSSSSSVQANNWMCWCPQSLFLLKLLSLPWVMKICFEAKSWMLSHFFLNYHKKHPPLNGGIPESRVGWEERASHCLIFVNTIPSLYSWFGRNKHMTSCLPTLNIIIIYLHLSLLLTSE